MNAVSLESVRMEGVSIWRAPIGVAAARVTKHLQTARAAKISMSVPHTMYAPMDCAPTLKVPTHVLTVDLVTGYLQMGRDAKISMSVAQQTCVQMESARILRALSLAPSAGMGTGFLRTSRDVKTSMSVHRPTCAPMDCVPTWKVPTPALLVLPGT